MSREIKFRAWNHEKKQMTYLESQYVSEGLYYHGKGTHTLMQYTGLKDKNGKEIYEKDCVLYNSRKFWVVWDRYRWKFRNKNGGQPISEIINNLDRVEVIGNEYELPELLEPNVT